MKIAICTIVPKLADVQGFRVQDYVRKNTEANAIVFLSPNEQVFTSFRDFYSTGFGEGRKIRFSSALFVLNPLKLLVWILRIKMWLNTSYAKAAVIALTKVREAKFICVNFELDKVYIWNRYCPEFGVMADVFKRYKQDFNDIEFGLCDGSLVVDQGFLGESVFFKSANADDASITLSWEQLNIAKGTGQYTQQKPNLPDDWQNTNAKRILVLGGSEIDAGIYPFWYRTRKLIYSYHKNGLDLANSLAEAFPRYLVVFKPHPKHNHLDTDLLLKPNLRVVNGDPSPLFKWCDVVVSNYTKLELQAFLYKKPLVNPSPGFLFYSNAVYTAPNREALKQTIELALLEGCSDEADLNARKFLTMYKMKLTL